MKKLDSRSLRAMWLKFFTDRGHAAIGSASVIPENDPTVLFTTAGMHPLVPYLSGQKHPAGTRLCNAQKCVRTGDIDEAGDDRHCTFFEMLGNWSLGDYFKKEAIEWSFEFLTSAEYLGIPVKKLAVSVFAGDADAPRDAESAGIWKKRGIPENKIFYLPKANNWWGPAGVTGPCGPDTEMFFDTGKKSCGPKCGPACNCGKYVEIWNDVFMQYFKQADGTFAPLPQKNVDTGMGLERALCVLNGYASVFETDVFSDAIKQIGKLSGAEYKGNERPFRIIADHTRTAVFMLGDRRGIVPSNVDQGYVLRRLIRRAVRYGRRIGLPPRALSRLAETFAGTYADVYPEIAENLPKVREQLDLEEERFERTLSAGLKEFQKAAADIKKGGAMDGRTAFRLYDTYGFPLEMTEELGAEAGVRIDSEGFKLAFAEHQAKSQSGAEQRFKGGLADASEETAALHTATHLLHAALRRIVGTEVEQRGSNITAERLRFDFSCPRKLEDAEIKEAERIVNEAIAADIPVECAEMSVDAARAAGALGLFGHKYGERVKVYTARGYSCEICGGPHAARTGDLGKFVITKEQSSSAGVRRIKAELRGAGNSR